MSKEQNIEYELMEEEPIRNTLNHSLYSLNIEGQNNIEVLRILYLHTLGYNKNQIAKHFKMSASRVAYIMQSDEFRMLAQDYTKNTLQMTKLAITMMSEKALQTMVKLLDSKNEKIQLSAAKDLLDRAGLVSKQVIEFSEGTGMEALSDANLVEVVTNSMQDILRRKELPQIESNERSDRTPETGSI